MKPLNRLANLNDNLILANLPPHETKKLNSHLQLVSVETRQELDPVGSPLRYISFPINCAISLMDHQPSGRTVGIAVIGKEGCVGFNAVQGLTTSPCRTIVQIGGSIFRLPASAATTSVPVLQYSLMRLAALVFREAVISVGCSQFHSVDQRLGRWLLAHEYRTGFTTFPFTHDFLAEQLGVLRGTVTEALAGLQKKKIVKYGYRKVQLLDTRAMEKISCECFTLAKPAIEEYLADIRAFKRSMAD